MDSNVNWAETKIKAFIHVQGQPSKGSLGRLAVWSRSTLLSFRTWPSFCYCFLPQSFNHLFLPQPTTFMCTSRRKGSEEPLSLYPVSYSPLAPIRFFLSLLSQFPFWGGKTAVLVMLDWNTEGKLPLGKRYLMNQQYTISCMFPITQEPSS